MGNPSKDSYDFFVNDELFAVLLISLSCISGLISCCSCSKALLLARSISSYPSPKCSVSLVDNFFSKALAYSERDSPFA